MYIISFIMSIFFSDIRDDELSEVMDRSKMAIIETLLALSMFNHELDMKAFGLFTLLLLMKILHWLAELRVELIAQQVQFTIKDHIRLHFFIGFLTSIDSLFTYYVINQMILKKRPSVLLLFGFEYTILLVQLIAMYINYIVHCIDKRYNNEWKYKSIILLYVDILTDLMKLILYIGFFAIICTYYGVPLHLMRQLYKTFSHLRDRAVKFYRYRKLIATMSQRFPMATTAELQANPTCVICWDDMQQGIKLSCGHIYHRHCLQTWLQEHKNVHIVDKKYH